MIGAVGQMSGVVGTSTADMVRATQAWVKATNAEGGVNCFKIDYIVADDGGNAAQHQALVQKLVEQDKVVAMVTMTAALTGRASAQYLTDHRIPAIGGIAGDWGYASPMYFPASAGGGNRSGVFSTAEWAKMHGKKKVGIVTCVEASDCGSVNESYQRYAAEAGVEIVYSAQASVVQPDYTSVCQAAQDAGAEVLVPILGSAGLTRIGQSCARVNFRPLYMTQSVLAQDQHASDPNLTPLGVQIGVLPWMLTGNPSIAEFHRVLERYAPGVKPGAASVDGWVSAKLFEAATRNLKSPTSEAILEGLWSIKNDDLDGVTVPLTFTRGKPRSAIDCWWLVAGDSGKYTSPNQGKRSCV